MTDNVDDFLAHHGIKGMKWGVRKEEASSGLPQHPSYKGQSKAADTRNFGKDGSSRINSSLHNGLSLADARKREEGIHKEAQDIASKKIVGNAVVDAVGVGSLANLTVRAANKVAYSPTTLKVLGSMFGKAPFGAKVALTNAVIGARLVTDIANTPAVRQGITAVAGLEAGQRAIKRTQENAIKIAAANAEKRDENGGTE